MAAHRAQAERPVHAADRLLYLKGETAPDYNAIMAMALVSVLPMVLLFLFFQRYFVQGFARSGIK